MTIGLDTSVVVRLLTGEPADQADRALAALRTARERDESVLVSDLVVAETYFALQHHYGVPKPEARAQLLEMLTSRLVAPSPGSVAVQALQQDAPAGLVDCMVNQQYSDQGATTCTFDSRMSKLPGARRI